MSDFEGLDINMEETDVSSFIPEGDYPCIIDKAERKTSKTGNDYINVELSVTGEKYAGWQVRKIFSVWYQHADPQKESEIRGYAKRDFARLLKACGMSEVPKKFIELELN